MSRIDDHPTVAIAVAVVAADGAARSCLVDLLNAGMLSVTAQVRVPGDLAQCAGRSPDVVVMATAPRRSPSRNAVRTLRAAAPDARLVLVTPGMSGPIVRKALDAGVDAVVLEHEREVALGLAVRAVHAGQVLLPRSVRGEVEQPVLTFREKQVLGMVVMGFTNCEIAHKLYLAESTVKSHLSSVFSKLGVSSRHEAAARVLDPEQHVGAGVLGISQELAARAVA